MKQIALYFAAIVIFSLFLISCATTHRSDKKYASDYATPHALKPGLSLSEASDLLNGPSQLASRGDAFGRSWSIWYLDQNALPATSPQIPTNLVFTFDVGRIIHRIAPRGLSDKLSGFGSPDSALE